MTRGEAVAMAALRWGINGFAVRANDINPAARYRVGFVDKQDGKTVIRILGMGRSWHQAFVTATKHPDNEAQQQKATELRRQYELKKAALTSGESNT